MFNNGDFQTVSKTLDSPVSHCLNVFQITRGLSHVAHFLIYCSVTNSSHQWPLTFWTGSRCGQVKVRTGFQRGPLLVLLFFTLSESSCSKKDDRPPQSTRSSSFIASTSRRRPLCSWVKTTLSNRRPYSSSEPRPTDDQARSTNSVLDIERGEPEESWRREEPISGGMRWSTLILSISFYFKHTFYFTTGDIAWCLHTIIHKTLLAFEHNKHFSGLYKMSYETLR